MVKLFVHIDVELTFFQTNTNSFTTYAVKLFVHIEVELTLFQINTNRVSLHTRSNCLCILKLNSPDFKQIQTVSSHMQSSFNCLCTLKLNSHCFKQIQSVWPCTWLQVLWVYEETHSWPWISMICSVALMQNFTFLPWKLIASHTGFQGLNLFVLFHQHFCSSQHRVLLTMWTGVDSCSKCVGSK